jgi:hypothetical protein
MRFICWSGKIVNVSIHGCGIILMKMVQGHDQLSVYGGMSIELGLTDEDLEFLDSLNWPGLTQQPRATQERRAQRVTPTSSEFTNHVNRNPLHDSPLSH